MSALVSTIEIGRPPEKVFSYVTDPARFVAWQHNVVNGRLVGDGPARVGTKCITTRRATRSESVRRPVVLASVQISSATTSASVCCRARHAPSYNLESFQIQQRIAP
jgi:hypothetical protein